MSSTRCYERNKKAQFAEQYNAFYTKITSPGIEQVGCYRIEGELGQGSFGKVYKARHVLLNVEVVLKCGVIDDSNIVREIYYHRKLKHKNVVLLYEVIKTEKHLWLVLEYCEGRELYDYVYEKKRIGYHESKYLFYQIVEGLNYVHSLNLTHRDLKLENILLGNQKRTVVKLTDFGFVREFDPQRRLLLYTVCGTPAYMAPEIVKNERYSGFAVDIWSLGVILYTMLYGIMPFDEGDDFKMKCKILNEEPRFKETIPEPAIALLKRMLSKKSENRPSTVEILNSDFLADIRNRYRKNNKVHANCSESNVSLTQYRNSSSPFFQSKLDHRLIRKLKHINFDIDGLTRDTINEETNSLTAFYDLLLTCDLSRRKKLKHQERKRKYMEAKRSLRNSKRRVQNALFSEDNDNSLRLERILSSLSLASNKHDKYDKQEKKSPNVSVRKAEVSSGKPSTYATQNDQLTRDNGSFISSSQTVPNGVNNTNTNDESISETLASPYEGKINDLSDNKFNVDNKKGKNKSVFEKMQFWKKKPSKSIFGGKGLNAKTGKDLKDNSSLGESTNSKQSENTSKVRSISKPENLGIVPAVETESQRSRDKMVPKLDYVKAQEADAREVKTQEDDTEEVGSREIEPREGEVHGPVAQEAHSRESEVGVKKDTASVNKSHVSGRSFALSPPILSRRPLSIASETTQLSYSTRMSQHSVNTSDSDAFEDTSREDDGCYYSRRNSSEISNQDKFDPTDVISYSQSSNASSQVLSTDGRLSNRVVPQVLSVHTNPLPTQQSPNAEISRGSHSFISSASSDDSSAKSIMLNFNSSEKANERNSKFTPLVQNGAPSVQSISGTSNPETHRGRGKEKFQKYLSAGKISDLLSSDRFASDRSRIIEGTRDNKMVNWLHRKQLSRPTWALSQGEERGFTKGPRFIQNANNRLVRKNIDGNKFAIREDEEEEM